jgi:hypothetical protein
VSKLKFKIAEYDLEGTFLGFDDLSDQLVLCARPTEELNRVYDIGVSVQIQCTYDLSNLVSVNSYELPRKANKFYELFLEDYDGNLVDVPTMIWNVQSEDGDYPNQQVEDSSLWILTRRFFIFDTKSGVETSDWYESGLPSVIRYAKTMTLKINLDTQNEEMINVPYLFIEYGARASNYISRDSLTELSFNSEYIMSTVGFWEAASAIFFIFLAFFVIILLIVLAVMYSRPQLEVQMNAKILYIVV